MSRNSQYLSSVYNSNLRLRWGTGGVLNSDFKCDNRGDGNLNLRGAQKKFKTDQS
jgi:hypothetical protein